MGIRAELDASDALAAVIIQARATGPSLMASHFLPLTGAFCRDRRSSPWRLPLGAMDDDRRRLEPFDLGLEIGHHAMPAGLAVEFADVGKHQQAATAAADGGETLLTTAAEDVVERVVRHETEACVVRRRMPTGKQPCSTGSRSCREFRTPPVGNPVHLLSGSASSA